MDENHQQSEESEGSNETIINNQKEELVTATVYNVLYIPDPIEQLSHWSKDRCFN